MSPYVRRIAVTLNLYNMPFERLIISAIDDEAVREKINPVGRVPAFVLSESETIVDSNAILDHLDELAGADALLPQSGFPRRKALHQLALATGAIDRAMGANAERRRRPPDDDRLKRQLRQCKNGFTSLEALLDADAYFGGDKINQADVTIVVGMTFIEHIFPGTLPATELPKLHKLAAQVESLPAFSEAQID